MTPILSVEYKGFEVRVYGSDSCYESEVLDTSNNDKFVFQNQGSSVALNLRACYQDIDWVISEKQCLWFDKD
ncbi:MAG: hypothetical protein AV945_gp42 [Phormidium phage MIS-PhV1B]|jgi:hypothetical protein|uniref:hypothetical protein n=1 Tax=Phormidium phage MIS-PhV1B TaxID=1391456 RepID=UPI0003C9B0A1|nr:MAG: hypothetical protein AV945_gp42 [Phormidium phage MIS-PhV1B]AGZ61849.1 MAG: hypothetical protein [Phormidium phage MIS-PhV1B]